MRAIGFLCLKLLTPVISATAVSVSSSILLIAAPRTSGDPSVAADATSPLIWFGAQTIGDAGCAEADG